MPKAIIWFAVLGLATHFVYAMIKAQYGMPSAFTNVGLLQGFVYHIGATFFSLAISMLLVYLWASGWAKSVFKNLALLGRMALTNYIFQNVISVLLFFGYGLALMGKVPYIYLPLFAFGILAVQWVFTRAWLSRFRQGPLEFIWRKLSYRVKK